MKRENGELFVISNITEREFLSTTQKSLFSCEDMSVRAITREIIQQLFN